MKSFLRLKQDTEVDIDGMLVNEKKEIIINFTKIFTYLIYLFFLYLVYLLLFI